MFFGMADDWKILFDMKLCGEGWRRHYSIVAVVCVQGILSYGTMNRKIMENT